MRKLTGNQLRRMRRKAGLTITGVCSLTGIPRSTWENWEAPPTNTNHRRPSQLAFAWLYLYITIRDFSKDIQELELFLEDYQDSHDYPDELFEIFEEEWPDEDEEGPIDARI